MLESHLRGWGFKSCHGRNFLGRNCSRVNGAVITELLSQGTIDGYVKENTCVLRNYCPLEQWFSNFLDQGPLHFIYRHSSLSKVFMNLKTEAVHAKNLAVLMNSFRALLHYPTISFVHPAISFMDPSLHANHSLKSTALGRTRKWLNMYKVSHLFCKNNHYIE